jgi:hypothetical protein
MSAAGHGSCRGAATYLEYERCTEPGEVPLGLVDGRHDMMYYESSGRGLKDQRQIAAVGFAPHTLVTLVTLSLVSTVPT